MPHAPVNLFELEERAKASLTPHAWDFIDAGAQDEVSVLRNRKAFQSICLRTRFMRDVSQRDISTTILGERVQLPVAIAPAGRHQIAHPDGELASARAAHAAGTVMSIATGSTYSIEEVRAVSEGPLWFQLYHMSRDLSEMLVKRADTAGYKAICVTVDVPVMSPIERSVRHGAVRPLGITQANFVGEIAGLGLDPDTFAALHFTAPDFLPFTWADFDWLRGLTNLPIVLKGIRTAEDAAEAAERGVDGLVVSNHGGRQLDGTLSTIEMLPEIVAATAGRVEVFLDSGIRRGSDVIKALCLGARAVMIGRPVFWGLAWNGEDGVRTALELLRAEIDLVLGHLGCTSLEELGPEYVRLPTEFGRFSVNFA